MKECGTLTVTRRPGEAVMVGDEITVRIGAVSGEKVRVQVTAPRDVDIVREELLAGWESRS